MEKYIVSANEDNQGFSSSNPINEGIYKGTLRITSSKFFDSKLRFHPENGGPSWGIAPNATLSSLSDGTKVIAKVVYQEITVDNETKSVLMACLASKSEAKAKFSIADNQIQVRN